MSKKMNMLPYNWTVTPLKTVISVVKGKKPKSLGSNSDKLPIPYIDIKAIEKKIFSKYTNGEKCTICEPSDVLIVWDGARFGWVGKGASGAVGSTLARIDVLNINSEYLFYYLKSKFKEINTKPKGVGIPHVNPDLLYNFVFPIAPLPEQNRIVEKIEELFTRLDSGIESLKRVQKLLKRYRQSLLKSAFEGKLSSKWHEQHKDELEPADKLLERILKERKEKWVAEQLAKYKAKGKTPPKNWQNKYKEPTPPDTSKLPELPKGWVWVTAEQLTYLITDGEHITPPRTHKGISPLSTGNIQDQVLLLSARNIQDGFLSFEKVDYIAQKTYRKLKERLTINSGDVLMSCSGSVGRSCVAPSIPVFALVRSVAVLKPIFKMGEFISYCIRSPLLQGQISEKKTQTAQANIFQNKIRQLIFPLAPLREQKEISEIISEYFSNAEKSETALLNELKRSQSLRQAILKRAYEGKLVPQDPNDEHASVLLDRIKIEKSNPKKSK
jgi:type I restriction enzyme S subunit